MRVGFTKSEWLAVTLLYRSENVEELRQAVAILQTWRVRMGNSLHVAAEMSEVLLAAIVADKETDPDDWLVGFNLRLLYSTAVIRFVNYVNELCQRRKPSQQMSVKAAVSMMNVPAWVVQVRHEATHSHLPSLDLLREATRWCKDWLWCNHWEKSIDEAMSSEEEQQAALATLTDRIVCAIAAFIRYRMANPNEELLPNTKRANSVINELERMLLANTNDFIEALLIDGYLIMTEKQLEIAAFHQKTSQSKIWRVPPTLQMFWRPVFTILSRAKALPTLLHELMTASAITHISDVRRRQLIGWADRMLDAFLHSQQLSEQEWKRIMRGILVNQDAFNSAHLEAVAQKITSMSRRKRRSLETLISMSPTGKKRRRPVDEVKRGDFTKIPPGGMAGVKTVEDVQMLKRVNAGEGEVLSDDAWVLCDASGWKGVPLGLTPEQTSDTLMLVIDSATFVPRVPCS